MKALITGADGFVGRWLSERLEACGDEVWRASGRKRSEHRRERAVDLSDPSSVRTVIEWARPDTIYHLAAVAFGPDAARDVGRAIDVTVRGTAFLLDSAAALPRPPTVLIPSSAEVYGPEDGDAPIDERRLLAPVNVYGATKVGQEAIALAYHRGGRLPVVVARSFNHIGPGQRETFVVSSFAGQLAEVASGHAPPTLRVGNLDARRDFTDVRDVVRAYQLLVSGGHAGKPVNVASGHAVSIRSLLDRLVAMSGLRVEIVRDPARMRALEVQHMVGDNSLLRSLTGWQPLIPLDRTLDDVWRDALLRHH